jgi:Uma2 family endonuclease
MTAMVVGASSPFTVYDLEGMPDDGRRYELVDGELLVSPAPGTLHQTMVLQMAVRLVAACPADLHVLTAPFAVRTDVTNEVQPDVLIARTEDLTDKILPVAPVLVAEVASPTTRMVDANLKRAVYERMGVPCFWLLDPDPVEPSLTARELDDEGRYQTVARVKGKEVFHAQRPVLVRIVPSELLAGLGSR